jgi:hypothetical protein
MTILKNNEPLSRYGWTLEQMLTVPNNDTKAGASSLGDQSLVGAIIGTAIDEEGAKWILSDIARMWMTTMPNLNMSASEIYSKLISKGTPHCVPCNLGQWKKEGNLDKLDATIGKVEHCFDCDSEEVLKQLAIRQARKKAHQNSRISEATRTQSVIDRWIKND